MDQSKEASVNPTTPHPSTGGADSCNHNGTPDTTLTAFSPDDGNSARSAKLMQEPGLDASNASNASEPTSTDAQVGKNGLSKDPFTTPVKTGTSIETTTPIKTEQKLSPTASTFRPIAATPIVAHGSLDRQSANGTRDMSPHYLPLSPQSSVGFSSDMSISRYLLVTGIGKPIKSPNVEDLFKRLEGHGVTPCGKRSLFDHDGKVYVRISHIQYATIFHDFLNFGGASGYHASFISASDFYGIVSPGIQVEAIPSGQVQVVVRAIDSSITHVTAEQVQKILNTVSHEAEIFAIHMLGERTNDLNEQRIPSFRALVEFADLDVAVAVMSKYNGTTWPGLQLWLTLPEHDNAATPRSNGVGQSPLKTPVSDITNSLQGMSVSKTPQRTPVNRRMHSPMGQQMPHQQVMYPVVYHNPYALDQTPTRHQNMAPMAPMSPMTPMPGGMPMMGPIYTPPSTPMTMQSDYMSPRALAAYGRPDGRRQNAMRVNRSPYHVTGSHHNQVDVDRIRQGIDVRTTIMLRNIPNKVNQGMLKEIIDQSSWGKYDFMYLRIDFANDCNVGYAFINFVDPLHIIDFVNARANQRWNCFKSDKVAEVSYATIQGKDCLVQKFRNSSVMLEAPHYRPKLYYTSNGPKPHLAGQEEPFPEPDNQSKMKRSCENAEHVGLFTPNAGQHFRDEQRRRRSQYDRGTRLAALEEYDYDAQLHQQQVFMPMGN